MNRTKLLPNPNSNPSHVTYIKVMHMQTSATKNIILVTLNPNAEDTSIWYQFKGRCNLIKVY